MSEVTVQTTGGAARGAFLDGVHCFKGIPYGASTAGKGRFMPPTRPEPWEGVRYFIEYGNSCPQPHGAIFHIVPQIAAVMGPRPSPPAESEDCLYLNVWTPSPGADARLPVMFWCHGGAFMAGSGSSPRYEGSALARQGAVVVTANHRLGPLGFLFLADLLGDEYASSGNAGMLDLVAALQWVHENIAALGGDPGNVTIFGESGGGLKVTCLLGMPAAKGLFHKAIIQSSPGFNFQSRETATARALALLSPLRISPRKKEDLQMVPVQRLIDAQAAAGKFNPAFSLGPVVDGDILPDHPFQPHATPLATEIPLIIGSTADEMTMFLGSVPILGTFSRPNLLAGPTLSLALRFIAKKQAGELLSLYRRAMPGAPANRLFIAAVNDWLVRQPSIHLAEHKAAGGPAPVFMYRFDWATAALDGKLGAMHTLDVPFVFDNLDRAGSIALGQPEAYPLAAKMSAAWLNFARTGRPEAAGLPAWPPYAPNNRATMIFDKECRVELDPGKELRLAWEKVKSRSIHL